MKDAMSLNMDGGEIIVNGPQGINGTPRDSTFLISAILLLITLIIVLNLINSRSGRAIMSIRDDRIAAESIGINITKFKLMAFAISSALAGVAVCFMPTICLLWRPAPAISDTTCPFPFWYLWCWAA